MKVAEAMISVQGDLAPVEARRKAAEALEQGDIAGFRAWCLVLRATRLALRDRAASIKEDVISPLSRSHDTLNFT
jgi:hypothetical protein